MGLNWDAFQFSIIAVVFSDLLRTGYHGRRPCGDRTSVANRRSAWKRYGKRFAF